MQQMSTRTTLEELMVQGTTKLAQAEQMYTKVELTNQVTTKADEAGLEPTMVDLKATKAGLTELQ